MESATATRLNRIAHELRRPLQTLALVLDPDTERGATARACIDQTKLALADLDRAINGGRVAPTPVPTRVESIFKSLTERWREADVQVDVSRTDAIVLADPARLGAALDNLVANGLAHGTGPVCVRARRAGGEVLFEVHDRGPSGRTRRPPDPRHGHGLRIAADAAEGCGGRLIEPRPTAAGTAAAIAIPASPTEPSP